MRLSLPGRPFRESVFRCRDTLLHKLDQFADPGDNVQDYSCGTDGHSTFETVLSTIVDADIPASVNVLTAPSKSVTGYTNVPSGTSAASTSNQSGNSSKKSSVPAIIGGLVGVLVLVAIVGAVIACFFLRGRKQKRASNADNGSTSSVAPLSTIPPRQPHQPGYTDWPGNSPQGPYGNQTPHRAASDFYTPSEAHYSQAQGYAPVWQGNPIANTQQQHPEFAKLAPFPAEAPDTSGGKRANGTVAELD